MNLSEQVKARLLEVILRRFPSLVERWAHINQNTNLTKLVKASKSLKEIAAEPDAAMKLKSAQEAIHKLRYIDRLPSPSSNESQLCDIDKALKAGWSYADIGTTEGEVKSFRDKKNLKLFMLGLIHQCRCKHDTTYLEYLLKYGDISPEEVRTSLAEIEKFKSDPS
jgi:hypothetical protein